MSVIQREKEQLATQLAKTKQELADARMQAQNARKVGSSVDVVSHCGDDRRMSVPCNHRAILWRCEVCPEVA